MHVVEQLARVQNARRDLAQELGREPHPEEIGERLGLSAERVRDALLAARTSISLESPVGEHDESTVADLVADTMALSPAQEAEEGVLAATLEAAFHQYLTPREAEVLRLRFGLASGQPCSLSEIATAIGVSRERVRQIEAEASRKLRLNEQFLTQFQEYAE